ncbi:MAG: AbrB/MazE/SpoVT family DNA-binding domain-containing protein [Cyanobium sp.]
MDALLTLTFKGQLVIPARLRQGLGLRAGDRLALSLEPDALPLGAQGTVRAGSLLRMVDGAGSGAEAARQMLQSMICAKKGHSRETPSFFPGLRMPSFDRMSCCFGDQLCGQWRLRSPAAAHHTSQPVLLRTAMQHIPSLECCSWLVVCSCYRNMD